MNSNHVRWGAFVLLLLTGILAVGDITKVLPFLTPQYAVLTTIILVAIKEALLSQVTPATNAQTPDNLPAKAPVVLIAALLCVSFGVVACNTASTNPTVSALENPNNEAKIVTGAVSIATTRFLQVNPSYQGETDAVADALVVLASGNPATLTAADITASLAKTPLSSATQKELGTDIPLALDLFNTSFAVNFPGVPPNYAIFLDAVANGIYAATGKPTVTLPVIPWPPVTPTPTPTPKPAA